MNLIDAIKSGSPFARGNISYVSFGDWVDQVEGDRSLLRQHILADDWEIQEPTVTITLTQFWDAIADAYKENGNLYPPVHELFKPIARKLGLLEP